MLTLPVCETRPSLIEPAFTLLVENLGPLELTSERDAGPRTATFIALSEEVAAEPSELPEQYVALNQPAAELRPAGAAGQWLTEIDQGLRPWEDTLLLRYGPLFGSTPPSDRLAEFVSVMPNAAPPDA